jgi:hypothetical protein
MTEAVETLAMRRLENTASELEMELDVFELLHESFSGEAVTLSKDKESWEVRSIACRLSKYDNAFSIFFCNLQRIQQETEQVFIELHEARKAKKANDDEALTEQKKSCLHWRTPQMIKRRSLKKLLN